MHLHLIMGLQYTLTPSPPSPFLPSFPLLPLLSHLSLPLSQNAESHPVCRRHRLTLAELMPIAWQRLTKYMLLINNIFGSYKKHWEDLDGGQLCLCVCVYVYGDGRDYMYSRHQKKVPVSVPFRSVPFFIPFRSVPFFIPFLPFRSVPFRSIPFRSVHFRSNRLPRVNSFSARHEFVCKIHCVRWRSIARLFSTTRSRDGFFLQ